MIYIAHRGNLNGPNISNENHPDYINEAIRAGFDVEIDVWFVDGKYMLGHDNPKYEVEWSFLLKDGENKWLHARDIETLYKLHRQFPNVFFHNKDEAVLTSSNFIWTYTGRRPLTNHSIAVLPEKSKYHVSELNGCAGICSDVICEYKEDYL